VPKKGGGLLSFQHTRRGLIYYFIYKLRVLKTLTLYASHPKYGLLIKELSKLFFFCIGAHLRPSLLGKIYMR